MKILFFLFFPIFNLSNVNCAGQDTTKFDTFRIDTFHLSQKQFLKTVAYSYGSLVFYVNYFEFKKVIVKRLKDYQPYRKETYKFALQKLKKDIRHSDTVYMSQTLFDSAQIIPFDVFLINQVEQNKCMIRDSLLNIKHTIIRLKGTKYYHPGVWGGRLYYFCWRSNTFP